MAISRNKKQPTAKKSRVKNATITNLADFDPKTTLVFDGDAIFKDYPEIFDLGNLQEITGDAYFSDSKVRNLGNLQTIGDWADFENSKVQNLGKLRTIGGRANFMNSEVQSLGELQTIGGSAYFWYSKFKSLGNLQTIGGDADFYESQVQNLGNLQTIRGKADFFGSQVQDLGNLQTIGGKADFFGSQVQDLGNLQTIGGKADFGNRIDLEAEWKARQGEMNYAKGGGVGNFPPKGELKNKENLLLKYEKIGSDYEFFVYKPEKKDVSSYEQIKYVCVNKDFPTRMSYNQFLNYLYAETYLDDRKYANGGGVEIPKNKSLRHFILNEMSAGMIANRTPFSDYATIDKIRIQAVQILNRDGDREYSMQSVSDLIQEALLEYEENKNYADGGGVGMPNAAWFVFQEKFPEAFEYYLKNNEYGVSKGDLMAMAYESTRGVDSAIPTELWKQVDNTMFYVYDYQNSSFGELVDLREKIKTSEVPVALSFVIDRHGYYGDDLPNELKNADFATALMYVYANRDVIDEFQIRPKRNVDNYADGGGVGVKKYEIRDYNDIYEGRYDEQGLIDWAKEYAQSRKEIIYINSVEDAKMYIESPDKNGNQNFEIYEYAKGGGVRGKDFVVEIYSTNFENTLIAERTFKTEKAAIRYAYSVEDLNDDGFYFNIFGLDKNGKNLIKVFGLTEAEEDLIRQNPKYKNCISWKLDMGVHSYPNNKTIFSKTFSRLDKALELAISLENESLSATINNLHYTTFIYANGGGVGDVFSMSKVILENGRLIEMVLAENVSVADFERLFTDKGYIKKRDTTLVGFHFVKPNGDTIQLIPSFHKKGEIIRYAEGGGVGNSTITDLADFDTETTLVFDGDADFADYPEITDLGNLQKITGDAYFEGSKVQSLGNLQTIEGGAYFWNSQVQDLGTLQEIGKIADFENSQVQSLGNLQTIGGGANFSNSQVQSLGNLQTIGRGANFYDSQVKDLGNLQTIGGKADFGNRIDLEAEWKARQGEMNYAKGGGVGEIRGGIRYVKGKELEWYSIMSFDIADYGKEEAERKAYNYIQESIKYWNGELNENDFIVRESRDGKDYKGSYVVYRQFPKYANGGGVGQFNIGQSVMIAENNDNENYDDFRGKELVIYHKATNEKEHRGFDNSMEGQALYSFFLRETGEQVPFSCYDYELEQY